MASTNLSLDDLKNKVNKLENKQVNEMARIKELENKQDLLDNKQAVLEKKVDDDYSFNEEENIIDKQLWSGIPSEDIDNFNKNIEIDIRPQMSSSLIGESLKNLKSHELDFINNIKNKEMKQKKKTVMDEDLGTIIDKTINFLVHFIDDFHKYVYKAEVVEKVNLSNAGIFKKIQIYLLAFIYFVRESENVIYLGFFILMLSIIIFFLSIII